MMRIVSSILIALALATQVYALPALQLDIVGGTYDNASETIIAPGNTFILNALLNADKDNSETDMYFLSAALLPKTAQVSGGYSYGSFKVNDVSYNVTSDMVYGTPPLDALYPDLGRHSIYDTYYRELSFKFPATLQYTPYNSQDDFGSSPTHGSGMYVNSFNIDISGLNKDLGIHFDLYNENIKTKGNSLDYNTQFAPYSHDAEGWYTVPNDVVPEPGTMMLLGIGMLGLAIYGKRRMNKEA